VPLHHARAAADHEAAAGFSPIATLNAQGTPVALFDAKRACPFGERKGYR